MGVRIQELPETTGINKEDVLIVEDGQGTKKGTVKQLDETLGVSQLKEDLGDCVNKLGIYKPLNESGTTTSSGNEKIVENIELVSHRNYTLTATLESPSDKATYIALWSDTIKPEGYIIVLTIPAGELTATRTTLIVGNATDGYITISTDNRTLNWNVTLTDDAEHTNRLDSIEGSISELDENINKISDGKYYKKTDDLSFDIKYTDRADAYATSERISVSYGDIVKTYNKYTPYRQVIAYYNGVLVETVDNVWSYTVPDGVNEIELIVYKNQKNVDDTVIVYHTVKENEYTSNADYSIRKPRVTIIDDDGNVEFYTHLLPIMKKYNVPMVSAYMGDSNPDMQSNTAMMTKEQCKEVVDAGGEIIVHYNPDLTTLSLDEAERIVLKSKNVLKKYGFDSDLIAYSNGTSNPDIRAMVSKYFKAGFTGSYPRVSDTDRTNHDVIPQYFIHREHVGGLYYDSSAITLDYFKALVDECVSNNSWLVLITHSWLMPDGKKKTEFESIDQLGLLEDVIEYIQSLEESTGIKIVTASEGLEMFGNVMQSGDYLGHWNEMTLSAEESAMMGGHNDAGCAINKVGQYDFPTSKKINHN